MNSRDLIDRVIGNGRGSFAVPGMEMFGDVWGMMMRIHGMFTKAYPAAFIFSIMTGFVCGMISTRNKKARRFFFFGLCLAVPFVLTFFEFVVPYIYEASLSATGLIRSGVVDGVWEYIMYVHDSFAPVYPAAMAFTVSGGLLLQFLARKRGDMRRYIIIFMCFGLPAVMTAFLYAVPRMHALF